MIKSVKRAIYLTQKISMIQKAFKLEDHIEVTILHRIALYDASDEQIAVTQVIHWTDIGSTATVHGRLTRLIARRLLSVSKCPDDKRLRFVQLSPSSLQYFKEIGEALASSEKNAFERGLLVR